MAVRFTEGGLQSYDPAQEFVSTTGGGAGSAKSTAAKKKECEDKGWIWDEETQTCRQPKAEIPKGTVETFKSGDTGRVSGVTLPDGRTFFGLSPDEVERVAAGEAARAAIPATARPVGTAQEQLEAQIRLQNAIAKIGQIGGLTPAEESAINWSQAATAGMAGVLPGVLTGAAAGAVGGAAGGIGAIPGAVGGAVMLGGIGTFVSGLISNIKSQQKGELQAAKQEMTAARTNMRQLAMLASRDAANADFYISQYNEQLTRVYQAERQVKVETSGDLNAWMEDGRADLAEFEVFLRDGGIADIYGQKLQVALQTGTPLSLTGDQLFLGELTEEAKAASEENE